MTKGIGDKVLGWFIVDEDANASANAKAEVKAEVKAVVRGSGVADQERERLAKVVALLESLPSEASVEVKRAIVGASLEAFGVPIDRILATAEGALGALDARVAAGQEQTHEVLQQAEVRIAKLTAEIAEARRVMEVQVATQQELLRATITEKAKIRVALDFFEPKGRRSPGLGARD